MKRKGNYFVWMLTLLAFLFGIGLVSGTQHIFAAEITEETTQKPDEAGTGNNTDQTGAEGTQQPDEKINTEQNTGDWLVAADTAGRLTCTYKGNRLKETYVVIRALENNGYEVVAKPDASGAVYFCDGNGYGSKYAGTGMVTITGDGGSCLYYVKNGIVKTTKSVYYIVYDNYLYEVSPSGAAVKRIKDKNNAGTYRRISQGMCYVVSYKTGAAKNYTGVFRGIYYKNGVTGTAQKAYYIIYKSHCYKVGKSGNAAVYVKDSSKKGTYKKEIGGICYKVNYKTGSAKKYTGWYQNKYYVKGKLYSGWRTISSKRYYLKKGVAATGWATIEKKKYYFNQNGVLLKNQIVGSRYVDKNGVYVKDKTIQQAVNFVNAHSSSAHSRSVRLKECYDYLWKNIAYKRTYGIPGRDDMDDIAYSMMRNKYGNCFCFGSTFAYIARVLGYDSRVAVGEITSTRGGMTPHGWAEIYVNGKWQICDPDMQMNYPTINVYMRTTEQYPYKHNTNNRYYLKTLNGKVTWK